MDALLTTTDVFEIAERIERNTAGFYMRAAKMSGLGITSSMFCRLAEVEIAHAHTFARLRRVVFSEFDCALPLDANSRTARYLLSLVRNRFFAPDADPAEHLYGTTFPRDVIYAAIGFERQTIDFYTGLREVVATDADQRAVDAIIAQEQRHVVDLSGQVGRLCA